MTNPAAFNAAASNPKFADLMKKMGKKMGVPEDTQAAAAPGGPRMKPTGDDGRWSCRFSKCKCFPYSYLSFPPSGRLGLGVGDELCSC